MTMVDTARGWVDAPRASGRQDRASLAAVRDFDRVYAEHVDYVFCSLRSLGVREPHLDDCVQEVFLAIHRRLDEFEGRSALKTWIFGFALGVARNHRRTLRRKGELAPLDEERHRAAGDPQRSYEATEALRALESVLDRLPEEQREVFAMADVLELSGPEIAEVLGVKVNTVYSRLRLARARFEQLAEELEGRWP